MLVLDSRKPRRANRATENWILEHATGLAGGLRPLCASRAKLGREPATPTLAREDEPEEDQ
jgi:hypothetical protein